MSKIPAKRVRCNSCASFIQRECQLTGEKHSGGRHRTCTAFKPKLEKKHEYPYLPWNWKELMKEYKKKVIAERKAKAQLAALVPKLRENMTGTVSVPYEPLVITSKPVEEPVAEKQPVNRPKEGVTEWFKRVTKRGDKHDIT